MFSLENKTILITGASSGIGKAIAIACANQGATVVITGRNEDRLAETLNSLSGSRHISIAVDLADTATLDAFVKKLPQLHGFVNSAGIVKLSPAKFIKEKDLADLLQVNYVAGVMLTQLLLKNKKIINGGSIVYIASLGAYISNVGNAMYSGTKGAVISSARVFAHELAPQKIRVNCIAPGMVKTPLAMIFESTNSTEAAKADEALYPLGYGLPEDVAGGAVFLLTEASKWITGTTLIMDGGLSIH